MGKEGTDRDGSQAEKDLNMEWAYGENRVKGRGKSRYRRRGRLNNEKADNQGARQEVIQIGGNNQEVVRVTSESKAAWIKSSFPLYPMEREK